MSFISLEVVAFFFVLEAFASRSGESLMKSLLCHLELLSGMEVRHFAPMKEALSWLPSLLSWSRWFLAASIIILATLCMCIGIISLCVHIFCVICMLHVHPHVCICVVLDGNRNGIRRCIFICASSMLNRNIYVHKSLLSHGCWIGIIMYKMYCVM